MSTSHVKHVMQQYNRIVVCCRLPDFYGNTNRTVQKRFLFLSQTCPDSPQSLRTVKVWHVKASRDELTSMEHNHQQVFRKHRGSFKFSDRQQ